MIKPLVVTKQNVAIFIALVCILIPPVGVVVIGTYIPLYVIHSDLIKRVGHKLEEGNWHTINFENCMTVNIVANYRYIDIFGKTGILHLDFILANHYHATINSIITSIMFSLFVTLHILIPGNYFSGIVCMLYTIGIGYINGIICSELSKAMDYKQKIK